MNAQEAFVRGMELGARLQSKPAEEGVSLRRVHLALALHGVAFTRC